MKTMALREQDLELMAKHMQKVFPILRELSPSEQVNTPAHEAYLLELRHQKELLEKLIHQMDKRFEQMDKRFEQVDKQFEEARDERNKRFEQVDKQFERERDERNKQFERERDERNKQFEQVNKQFEVAREERYRQSKRNQWMIGIGFTIMTIVMSLTVVMK